MQRLDRNQILARIPHQGRMCLIDAVIHWDDTMIFCSTLTHRDPGNPLRRAQGLGGACGIEYAAQAMALHGAMTKGDHESLPQGFLASARDVDVFVDRLDNVDAPLDIRAIRMAADHGNVLYRFEIHAQERLLLRGRVAIVLDGGARRCAP